MKLIKNTMKPITQFFALTFTILTLSSCSTDDDDSSISLPDAPNFEVPTSYTFERSGQSTVNFPGQTQRILMGEELINAFLDFNDTALEETLANMFANENAPFQNQELNASSRQIRNTLADSEDFFLNNNAEAAILRAQFDSYISNQATIVQPNINTAASPGQAGQIADGTNTRYVSGQGLEFNQLFTKGLVGGLMLDQIVNNYVSASLLDAGDNRETNDNQVPRNANGTDTQMEHNWDEAYGYLYGVSPNQATPNTTIGDDDNFLNRYTGLVDRDPDFNGIANDIFQAFLTGRAAISQSQYEIRDEQAEIIRERLSTVIAIRAVFYLQQGRSALELPTPDFGAAFHDISEGLGFIVSLQFTRQPNSTQPYFTRSEVDTFIDMVLGDGNNGLWDVTPQTLNTVSEAIASPFNFTVSQAGDSN